MAGKKSGNVLNEQPSPIAEKSVGDPCCLEEEDGALASEPGASTGDGEVLAGEAAEDEVDSTNNGSLFPVGLCSAFARSRSANDSSTVPSGFRVRAGSNSRHVIEAWDSWPVPGEDFASVGVLLALGDDVDSGSVHSEVEPARPTEEGDAIHAACPS